MSFSKALKRIVSVDVKTRLSVKVRILGIPVIKIRTKRLSLLAARFSDLFYYRSRKNVLALKCPCPPDEGRFQWGDFWLAEDLKKGFEQTGKTVRVDFVDRFSYPADHKNALTLTIRGLTPYVPPAGKSGKHTLYLLSHPEKVPDEELKRFNAVACASLTYSEQLKQRGIPCDFIPQFTDPEKFFPAPDETLRTKILFVGNSRGVFRNGVKFALEQKLPLTVYGADWEPFGVETAGSSVSNTRLHAYYSSADIVLCDHWEDMLKNGFIANRIFDASASGAFIISDFGEEIRRLYGESIPMYRNAAELGELARYYLSHPQERRQKAEQAREITLKTFTLARAVERFNALFARF